MVVKISPYIHLHRRYFVSHLDIVDALGAKYYRLNIVSAQNYLGGEAGSIAAAPLIHTYSPCLASVSPKLALRKDCPAIKIGQESYSIKRFLTVQCLDASFIADEGAGFSPTVKPHYAIVPVNAAVGCVYRAGCKTLIINAQDHKVIENRPLQVIIHDGLVSPRVSLASLACELVSAQHEKASKFYTSYVVDEENKQILVTQHCLLNEAEHEALCSTLDLMTSPTLEDLIAALTPITGALNGFNQPYDPAQADDFAINRVFRLVSPTLAGGAHVQAREEDTRTRSHDDEPNYWLLMATLAYSAAKLFSVIIFIAGVVLIGLVIAELSSLPIMVGTVLAAVGMFSGAAMYMGNMGYRAAQPSPAIGHV